MPRISISHVLDCSYVKICIGGECGYISHKKLKQKLEELGEEVGILSEIGGATGELVVMVGGSQYAVSIGELSRIVENSYRACKRRAVLLKIKTEEEEGEEEVSEEEEEAVEELASEEGEEEREEEETL